MNEKAIKDAKDAIKFMKVFAVVGVVIAIVAFAVAAWSWGLLAASKELPSELIWEAGTVPIMATAFGFIILVICASSLHSVGKFNKALQSVKSDMPEEDKG